MTQNTTPDTSQEIPYGYCHWGCGQKTNLSTQNRPQRGFMRGEPVRFVRGHAAPPPQSARSHFDKYLVPGAPDECWLWKGWQDRKGYGMLEVGSKRDGTRRRVSAHRLSYELNVGPIPASMSVCHRCDMPLCCNPAHLWLGTHVENMADRDAKERTRSGSPFTAGHTYQTRKLTSEMVAAIRARLAQGEKEVALAREFGVSETTMWRVARYKAWR